MAKTYSAQVLEETPARATKLLAGIGRYTEIRTQMGTAGLADKDIEQGRTLLLACLAAPTPAGAPVDNESALRQREASAELDRWDEPNFPRFAAALEHHVPAVGEVMFHELKPSTGPAAVAGVATLVLRADALAYSTLAPKDAKAAKVSDAVKAAAEQYAAIALDDRKRALALLETRGLTTAERARLGALVNIALGPTEATPAVSDAHAAKVTKRIAALTALRRWYDDWASTARATIHKKAHLIALGLANRKMAPKGAPTG